MNLIQKIGVGSALIGALALGNGFEERVYAGEAESGTSRERVENPQDNEQVEKPIQYELIREHILDFQRSYLERICQRAGSFKKRAKKHGFDEFVKIYSENHIMLLEAALEDREDKEDLDELVDEISTNMGSDGGSVNYKAQEVLERLEDWAKCRIDYFNTLLEASAPTERGLDGFREMFCSVYDEEKLDDYLVRQRRANERLYDALQETLSGLKWLLSDNEFNPIREETRRVYNSLRENLNKE